MLLFVAVCCLVHVANIIHAFAVLIAFRSVCLLVLALAGIASVRGPGRKPGTGLFFAIAGRRKQAFFWMSRQIFKSLLARGWQAFWPKKSNDEQIYSKELAKLK